MRFILSIILLFSSLSIQAQDNKIVLKNEREGKSFYNSWSKRRAEKKALKKVTSQDITRAFGVTLGSLTESKLCALDINSRLTAILRTKNSKFKEIEGALYHLRSLGEFDDVVLKILLKAHELEETDLRLPKQEEDLWLPRDNQKLAQMLESVAKVKERLKEGCLEETYRNLYGEVVKIDKGVKSYHFEALFVEAYKLKLIDFKTYALLEKARVKKLETQALDLKAYYKKIKSLRTHFPLRDPSERSDFTSTKYNRKASRRQRLLENYSDLQIMLMGDVIKKLRSRLDSDKVEILVYARDQVEEVIPLEPMERFRFAIKVLRKEMAHLALNTYFKGTAPEYIDLMTAAYETGIIAASEMEEIAGLEEIWNPKKTFWEKASVWVRTFGSVASILIPPPYGFLPALGLMVIEFTTGKNKNNTDDSASLF